MRVILLILIGLNSLSFADFSRNSNGVVSDSINYLEWQDSYADNGDNIKQATWKEAIDYCEALSLDSKSDWRLPNINELGSLVDYSRYDPAINSIFQNTNSSYYWSSTSFSKNSNVAWLLYFNNARVYIHDKAEGNDVRCVRAGE